MYTVSIIAANLIALTVLAAVITFVLTNPIAYVAGTTLFTLYYVACKMQDEKLGIA